MPKDWRIYQDRFKSEQLDAIAESITEKADEFSAAIAGGAGLGSVIPGICL